MARAAASDNRRASCDDDEVVALLRAHGLRPTKARCQLLGHLRSTDLHPSAEEIASRLRAEGSEIGVATVYQNLNRLVESGLVVRLSGADGRSRFDADMATHDHAVCESCGRIVDVALDEDARHVIDRASASEPHLDAWVLTRTTVEMRGVCPECRAH